MQGAEPKSYGFTQRTLKKYLVWTELQMKQSTRQVITLKYLMTSELLITTLCSVNFVRTLVGDTNHVSLRVPCGLYSETKSKHSVPGKNLNQSGTETLLQGGKKLKFKKRIL
jgi:hypothetical protein